MKSAVFKIPTIIGLLLLTFGVGAGVYLMQSTAIFRLKASPEVTPQDVRVTNVTDTSVTISWITDAQTIGTILWGTDPTLGRTQAADDATLKNVHTVTIKNLTASTVYYFKISSAGREFDNNGLPWQAKTNTSLSSSNITQVFSGSVQTTEGQPASNVLVYITSGDIAPLSAKTSSNGTWIIPLSTARNAAGTAYANINNATPLQVFVQGALRGVATAQVVASAANPIPPMKLGQTYDFRTQTSPDLSALPESSIDIPDTTPSAATSRFNLEDASTSATQTKTVTLKSIDDGEIISTQAPEFFGDGPPGTQITIKIESDPINGTAAVGTSGTWRWSPPTNLPEGTHKITLSWKDASGILRQITRSFVVSAQEGDPSFESTPSATTPRPATPTPAPTVSPTFSPTPVPVGGNPTPSATPTATPRMSLPSTDSGTPIAGGLTPTLLLSIIGLGLLVFASYISIKATN